MAQAVSQRSPTSPAPRRVPWRTILLTLLLVECLAILVMVLGVVR